MSKAKSETMWAIYNFNRLMAVGHRRGPLIRQIIGEKKGWDHLRRKRAVRCVRVEVREIARKRP